MPKVKISEFDTVAANNTDIDGINLGEGMLPSDVNNAMRELMAQLKDFQAGTVGDSFNGPHNGTVGASTPAAGTFTSLSDSGNLTFTGTGNRILGDFSNATFSNRVAFQTSTVNANTALLVIPNGTGTTAQYQASNNSDPTNSSLAQFAVLSTDVRIMSNILGTGTYLPLTMFTGGSERLRIDTSGNVGIGTSSPSQRLDVRTAAGTAVQQNLYTGSNAAAATLQFGQIGAIGWDVGITATNGHFQIGVNGGGLGYNINRSATAIDYHSWLTAGSERMRIDSSGNVGIGTSSPTNKLDVVGDGVRSVARASTTAGEVLIEAQVSNYWSAPNYTGTSLRQSGSTATGTYAGLSNANLGSLIFQNGSAGLIATNGGSPIVIATAATERMRITAGGEVYIAGTTDQGAFNLQCNGTGVWGAGAYTNGSDARIKEDIASIDSGLDVVTKLNPVTYRYKEDWSKDQNIQPGFIAQELLVALEGTNYVDGVVTQGGEYMSVAYQNLIPILTKAIQEQQTLIKNLTTRLNALEGK